MKVIYKLSFFISIYVQTIACYQYIQNSKNLYQYFTNHEYSFYDPDNGILGTSYFMQEHTYSRQPYVANGYIGSRIPNVGFGFAFDSYNIWTNDSNIDGALNNGWPLRNRRYSGSFISDFYSLQPSLNSSNFPELDKEGFSTVISSIPDWTNIAINIEYNNTNYIIDSYSVKQNQVTNYYQNLSMETGIVTTSFDYLNIINLQVEVLAHRKFPSLGILTVKISSLKNISIGIKVIDILDYNTSQRTDLINHGYNKTDDAIYMNVKPENVYDSIASVYSVLKPMISLSKTFESYYNTSIQSFHTFEQRLTSKFNNTQFIKYVGIASSPYQNQQQNDNIFDIAKNTVYNAQSNKNSIFQFNKLAWEKLYNGKSITFPSDSLLELTAKSSLFHLLANTRISNVSHDRGLPLSVSGLSSDSYGGMVFWDTDFWIQPALTTFYPDIAKNLFNYRLSSQIQAILNAKKYGYKGAVYPWTSGKTSNCTSSGPCIDYEYHINIDISLSSILLYLSGNVEDEYLQAYIWPLVRNTATFFTDYVTFNNTSKLYETRNLTDPDEYADFIDNGAFTNLGIKVLLRWATNIGIHLNDTIDPTWKIISDNIYIPKAPSNITLEYSTMNGSVDVKQADVLLMTYPLGFIKNDPQIGDPVKNLYYYSEHQSSSGPAMTYPVFVSAANELLDQGYSSQSYLYKSILPYLRGPFAQFSEQSNDNFLTNGLTQPAFPFLTANGGFVQSVVYGLGGLRYSYEISNATGSIKRILHFNPVKLPFIPGGMRISGFTYMGQELDITIQENYGYIAHKKGSKPIKVKFLERFKEKTEFMISMINLEHGRNETLSRRFFSDENTNLKNHVLKPGYQIRVPLFEPQKNMPNNVAEGAQIVNLSTSVQGDVPFSAIDGNNYTHWQSLEKNKTAQLLLDLGESPSKIRKCTILWGRRPPRNVSISIIPTNDEKIIPSLDFQLRNQKKDDSNPRSNVDSLNFSKYEQANVIKFINDNSVSILYNKLVQPSEPIPVGVYSGNPITLFPNNISNFDFHYPERGINNTSCIPLARYVIVSFQGTFDNDTDPEGATLREIALFEK